MQPATEIQPQTAAPSASAALAVGKKPQAKEISKPRAAAGRVEDAHDTDLLQLVTFVVGNEEFGVSILSVQEINRMMPITRVPQSPPFVEGVINLRGRIIPVINLRQRFGMPEKEHGTDSRIIVVEVGDRTLGFTVDRVHEVLRIARSIVEPAPTMATGVDSEYLDGIAKLDDRLLILLGLERLFNTEQLVQIDRAMR